MSAETTKRVFRSKEVSLYAVRMYGSCDSARDLIHQALFVHGAGFYHSLGDAKLSVEQELIETYEMVEGEDSPRPEFVWEGGWDVSGEQRAWTLDMYEHYEVVYRITQIVVRLP